MFIDRTAIKSTATCAQKLDPHITHGTKHGTITWPTSSAPRGREMMMAAAAAAPGN